MDITQHNLTTVNRYCTYLTLSQHPSYFLKRSNADFIWSEQKEKKKNNTSEVVWFKAVAVKTFKNSQCEVNQGENIFFYLFHITNVQVLFTGLLKQTFQC